ncbi:unannotated protein [freshwater metagenome]|uniref:Unannotated protein n=1 Tax=freshwater metagenome TaxID=449393 RepID=A0A6J7H8R8_9ZZZZ
MHYVLQTRDRGLELAWQVRVLGLADVPLDDLVDGRRRVENLVDRFTCQRGTEHHTGAVSACLGRLQADCLDSTPDLGDVLDLDPVKLDVLAIGEVRGVAAELLRDLSQSAQLLQIQCTGIAPDAHHEVLRLEQVDVVVTGEGAVVALFTLGVETPPAEPAAQIALVDAVETLLRVDVLDAGAHVERVVVLLGLLVGVERLSIAQSPLAFGATLGRPRRSLSRCGGGSVGGRVAGRRHAMLLHLRCGPAPIVAQKSAHEMVRNRWFEWTCSKEGWVSSRSCVDTTRCRRGRDRHGGAPRVEFLSRSRVPLCHVIDRVPTAAAYLPQNSGK